MLFCEQHGDATAPAVLLLHGLGTNGAVWDDVCARLPRTLRVIVPDFAGHGRSPRRQNYSLGRHAADVAALLPAGAAISVLGHSMGGGVGLMLATGWFGVTVDRVVTVGMKMDWTPEELARMGRPFPVRWFDSREDAARRFLTVTGLAGIMPAEARAVERSLLEDGGRFRLATDPETVRVVGPHTAAMIAAATASGAVVRLTCGSHDPMVALADLRRFDPSAFTIEGGHNAHVENAEAVAASITALMAAEAATPSPR